MGEGGGEGKKRKGQVTEGLAGRAKELGFILEVMGREFWTEK